MGGGADTGDDEVHIGDWIYEIQGDFNRGDWKKYRDATEEGFRGSWVIWQAHHVIPITSVKHSTDNLDDDKKSYVEEVKKITDWQINASYNMFGLPDFNSYYLYELKPKAPYKLPSRAEHITTYPNIFNRKDSFVRKKIAQAAKSPKGYVIHLPTPFGHLQYNADVCGEVETRVIIPLKKKKGKHELDAQTMGDELDEILEETKEGLEHSGATMKKFSQRKSDNFKAGWHTPFMMADTGLDPVYGSSPPT